MNRWWGIRHVRFWYWSWRFWSWWNGFAGHIWMQPNPRDLEALDAIWRGEAEAMIREEGEEQERERWAAWERRRCCCVMPDPIDCIHQRYGYAENEVDLPREECECVCHNELLQKDW